jgi:hypothetical protein
MLVYLIYNALPYFPEKKSSLVLPEHPPKGRWDFWLRDCTPLELLRAQVVIMYFRAGLSLTHYGSGS